jgi:O-Antigen ligase
MVKAFRRFALFYPYVTVVALLIQIAGVALPTLPDTRVPMLSIKTGDMAVHLAGASVLFLVGLLPIHGVLWLVSLFAAVLICASGNRGAALSYLAATAFVILLFPRARSVAVRFLLPLALLFSLTFFIDPDVRLHQDREISLRQLAINYASIVTNLSDNPGNTEGTKQWRLMWWKRIVDYTIFGDYFWRGKGYGVNLTTADGFRSESGLLRSPHNVHMTILARSGVIGLALWLLLQGVWFTQVLRRHIRAKRARHSQWAAMFLALAAYWVAFLVNASFDVFLEGPMGGVWFWVLFGFGLAAVRVYDSWTAWTIDTTGGQRSPIIA